MHGDFGDTSMARKVDLVWIFSGNLSSEINQARNPLDRMAVWWSEGAVGWAIMNNRGQSSGVCSCYYIIAGGYAHAYVIASGCIISMLTHAHCSCNKLLPSVQPSTTFLHHIKPQIHGDYYIHVSYYQISMHFTV